MTNRVYPNTVLADECRKAGARVRLCWEVPGPKGTLVAWLSCYSIEKSICIVETMSDGLGWEVLTPGNSLEIVKTVADTLKRCGFTA